MNDPGITKQVNTLQVTSAGIAIDSIPPKCLSVDVSFDGRRVWTIEFGEKSVSSDTFFPWPEPLRPYLEGRAEVTVADSASAEHFLCEEVEFSRTSKRTLVADAQGTPLTINKWGELAPDLAGFPTNTLEQLHTSAKRLVDLLHELGFRPFIVGGTLLGAVREGKLLPHDDDADIAYLSQHTKPLDVAIESFALGHELQHRGYRFARHSAAHIQVKFDDEGGGPAYHIDIFSAFFTDDGNINQPFHVRGPFREDQMLPFSTVSIDGYEFPAPADPESWLVINYDENWRTPIPGYRLVTPIETRRRFDNWFGGYNFQRDFWDRWFERPADAVAVWDKGIEWLTIQRLVSPNVLELGCGSAELSRRLSTTPVSRRIIATDYSEAALRAAAVTADGYDIELGHLNLNRLDSIGFAQHFSMTGAVDVVVNHVLEQVSRQARTQLLRIVRMALRGGGSAYATSYGMHAENVTPEDPTTWHLAPADLVAECAKLGLSATTYPLVPTEHEQEREPYGVRFTIDNGDSSAAQSERKSMSNKMRGLAGRLLRRAGKPEVDNLRRRIEELEQDLDELRRDNLRVSEMLDLLEQHLATDQETDPEQQ